MRLYLSGKMTGLPDNGFDEFNRVAAKLREMGFTVHNPAENDGGKVLRTRAEYLKMDLLVILSGQVDAIAVLPNWRDSAGAQLEVEIAKGIGLPIINAITLKMETETVIAEADRIVNGPRRGDYGHPYDDYKKVAELVNILLADYLKKPLTPYAACSFMLAVKLSRQINKHKRDNLVDLIGYTQCLAMIKDREELLGIESECSKSEASVKCEDGWVDGLCAAAEEVPCETI